MGGAAGFRAIFVPSLHNGLTLEENTILASTPHVDRERYEQPTFPLLIETAR